MIRIVRSGLVRGGVLICGKIANGEIISHQHSHIIRRFIAWINKFLPYFSVNCRDNVTTIFLL